MLIYRRRGLTNIIFVAVLIQCVLINSLLAVRGHVSKLPTKNDLPTYLKALERVLSFCVTHKNDLDLNFIFGLFLVGVNLKPTIDKLHDLKLKTRLTELLNKNDKMVAFFRQSVDEDIDHRNNNNRKITTLFRNESTWVNKLKKMGTRGLNVSLILLSKESIEGFYSDWSSYVLKLDQLEEWVPSPAQSDLCIGMLADNAVSSSKYQPRCIISKDCKSYLNEGTDFGYALTHRLLYLLLAQYGRGCTINAPAQDAKLRVQFCSLAYNEANFISYHKYGTLDFMLELMALCSLDGHAQFIQRRWMSGILRYQSGYGCFGEILPDLTETPNFRKNQYTAKELLNQYLINSAKANFKHRQSSNEKNSKQVDHKKIIKKLVETQNFDEKQSLLLRFLSEKLNMADDISEEDKYSLTATYKTPVQVKLIKHSTLRDKVNNTVVNPTTAQPWQMVKLKTNSLLDGVCNSHVTAVAAATLSSAVRYILEKFY